MCAVAAGNQAPFCLLTRVFPHADNVFTLQFTDSGKVADDRSYRDLAPDKPFTSPTFHAVLRAVLKGRHNAYTAHDIAFVDFICDAALRHINLQKKSASGQEESYLRLVAEARQLEGMEIQADDKSPPIKIISCKTTRGKR